MTTLLPKEVVVDGWIAETAALDELLSGLDPAAWSLPTPLPGWDVQANVAHIVGIESMLEGSAEPAVDLDLDALPHVRNELGRSNEAWIASMRNLPPAEVLGRLREVVARRTRSLRQMDQAAWDDVVATPAGDDSYGRFVRIRTFDCWMHEQDIRDAVRVVGHEAGPVVDLVLDEMTPAMGYVVGRRAGAPPGSSVTFRLTGEERRDIHVAVAERAAVVASLPGPATVTLTMPVGTFTRLGGGRITAADAAPQVQVAGDDQLGRRILENFAYMI